MQLELLLYLVYPLFFKSMGSQISETFDNDNTAFCCNSKPKPQVAPVALDLTDSVNDSPYYLQVTTPNFYTRSLDSVCYSYFNIDNSTYLQFTGIRYSDNSTLVLENIVSDLTGYLGVSRVQGLAQDSGSSTIIYDEVYLGCACPGLKVYYRNYIAGRCDAFNNLSGTTGDYVHGDSSCRDVSEYCKSQVAAVANSQQLRGAQLEGVPNRLNRCCVTRFNGASCVNADRVLPQDSVSVPDQKFSSQTC